ncbi:hypothetical protein ES754_02105 [Psychrobacter frigidicola]|uniref:Uncharacterized protein n=1 Tax=Psychrobacter frigidicola TaxID=45611 RepID=A0A5C7A5A9_9GAMM|nr:hypothetical protein [Psychrobacter frigidicola]TXD97790.1 hypothetical protein ES754_02105 [Psychrobacter frigidicola]
MNDSDNHNDDNQTDTFAANDTRASKPKRTSDIYERFLTRVEQLDGGGDDGFSKSSLYEPLSEEELRFFSDFSEQNDANNKQYLTVPQDENATIEEQLSAEDSLNVDLIDNRNSSDEYKNHDAAIEYSDETTDVDVSIDSQLTKNVSKAKESRAIRGRQVSSIKMLTIGVVCGLLLSVSIIFLLNKTGLLSVFTDGLMANNSETTLPNTQVVATAQPATETASQKTATQSLAEAAPIPSQEPKIATGSDNTPISNQNTVVAERAAEPKESTTSPNSKAVTDSNITYEDFREEAQNTLYRETQDSL